MVNGFRMKYIFKFNFKEIQIFSKTVLLTTQWEGLKKLTQSYFLFMAVTST